MSKEVKLNKSKTYLLPLLSEFININTKFISYLENTYLEDNENKYKDCIYILHDFNFKDKDFTAYEHELINNELYVDSYDIGSKVLYIFKFPEDYLPEYEFFKESKYSKFGEDAKILILEFWQQVYKNNPNAVIFLTKVKNILFKENKLKRELEKKLNIKINDDAELGEFIDINNETFNFDIINNITNENRNTEMW